MLETLRKSARKSNTLRVIFSVIGIVILLAVTKFAIFDVITGATKMDITADPASYEGKYVYSSTKLNAVLSCYESNNVV